MKNLKKSHSITGQSDENVRKSQKHDVNLQKNSTLYFQIGLILCLLGSYALLEMRFESKSMTFEEIGFLEEDNEIIVPPYVTEPDVIVKKAVQQNSQKLADKPPVVIPDDETITDKPVDLVQPTVLDKPLAITDLGTIEKPTDDPIIEIVDLNKVQRVPIYPGCEKAKNNKERLKCMSSKMNKLVQRKFNTDLATQLDLEGILRIDVQFKIDKFGNVTDIKTRSPYDLLDKEAQRVVNKIPTMKPGMQQEKPVAVLYYLPIKFKVQ